MRSAITGRPANDVQMDGASVNGSANRAGGLGGMGGLGGFLGLSGSQSKPAGNGHNGTFQI